MKVNVYTNNRDQVEGAENVALLEIGKLPDAQITDLHVNHSLDYVLSREESLNLLLSKMRYGGVVHIHGVELNEVARALYSKYISVDEAIGLLYGGRLSVSAVETMCNFLVEKGYTIIKRRVNMYMYYIEAQRNAKH